MRKKRKIRVLTADALEGICRRIHWESFMEEYLNSISGNVFFHGEEIPYGVFLRVFHPDALRFKFLSYAEAMVDAGDWLKIDGEHYWTHLVLEEFEII